MKITVCGKCGSQDLERLAWVLHKTNQYIDDHEPPEFYCNGKCGGYIGEKVLYLEYLEKYGSAYRLHPPTVEGHLPTLLQYPMFTDGSVQIDDEDDSGVVVDLDRAFTDEEMAEFYVDMKEVFKEWSTEIENIFKPYIKLFAGVWFAPVYLPTANLLTMDEINENKGYSKEDIEKVSKLELAEFVWLGEHPFTDKSHLVTRVS